MAQRTANGGSSGSSTPAPDGVTEDDEITFVPSIPSKRKLTAQVERAMRRNLAHHSLGDQDIQTPRAELIKIDADEIQADGRVKPLRRGLEKGTWMLGEEGEEREWPGLRVDGQEYWVKDGVTVRTKQGTRRGIIQEFFEARHPIKLSNRYRAHIHWLKYLRVGNDRELFLEDCSCDTVSVHHFMNRLDLVSPGRADALPERRLFCRFVAQADHRIRDPIGSSECDSCIRKRSLLQVPFIRKGNLHIGPDVLHVHDCILIDSGLTGEPHKIAQIVNISVGRLQGQLFDRYRTNIQDVFKDETRVHISGKIDDIPVKSIRGRCHVLRHAEEISKHDDLPVFWCQHPLPQCSACLVKRSDTLTVHKAFNRAGQLIAADYYSGAGGGILSAWPFFKVVSAVEMNHVACDTLWHNFSNRGVNICMARLEDLHARELQRENGRLVNELYIPGDGAINQRRIPYLPERGSVAVMLGGIPCQGHSRANRFQDAKDARNHELFYFMSEVSRVQPGYVVLENVPGFKDEKDDGSLIGGGSFAKVAIDMLLDHGYQCQLAVLDSRSYGSPQNRTRLWIMAAKSDLTLPQFPLPSHANPLAKASVFSLEAGTERPLTACYIEDGTVGAGPFPSITCKDAIDDLPIFEYRGSGIPRKDIPSFEARSQGINSDTRVGYPEPISYRCDSLTSYQRRMRGNRQSLIYHYTPSRGPSEIEKCHKAFEVDEKDLHETFADVLIITGSERKLVPDGGFFTLLTNNAPGQRANRPIHYNQRRTKTVAEDKRAMGFPDDFHLSGTAKEQIAQLGNAWVVQMGTAVIREIRNAIRAEWIEAGQPTDLEAWWARRLSRLPNRKVYQESV